MSKSSVIKALYFYSKLIIVGEEKEVDRCCIYLKLNTLAVIQLEAKAIFFENRKGVTQVERFATQFATKLEVENTCTKLGSLYRGIVILGLFCYKPVAPAGAFLSYRFFTANAFP